MAGIREKIKLVSTAKTGHFYTTDKNKRTMPGKLELKKYDPTIRKHVLYKKKQKSSNLICLHLCVKKAPLL